MLSLHKLTVYIITTILFLVATFNFSHAEMLNKEHDGYLTIGSISNTPKEEVANVQPFINYLVANIDNPEIKQGRVIIANSLGEMISLIKEGKVDLYFDSPFPIIAISEQTQSVPFLLRWKKGVKEYSSVIFSHKESGIDSIKDLKGKMIVFEEEFSTSGYFLPKATLLKEGMKLVEKLKKTDNVPKKKVGYTFSRDDETTMYWVLKKLVHAGALNKGDFKLLAKNKLSELKILQETIMVPRQILVHRRELPSNIVQATRDILINMNKSTEGLAVLKAFDKTTKFETLHDNSLTEVEQIYLYIKEEFGL